MNFARGDVQIFEIRVISFEWKDTDLQFYLPALCWYERGYVTTFATSTQFICSHVCHSSILTIICKQIDELNVCWNSVIRDLFGYNV